MAFPFTFERTASSAKFTVNSDGKFIKVYNDVYLCKSPINLTLDGACAELGVLPGSPHPDWQSATARSINPTRRFTREPHCAWDIAIEYSTDAPVPEDPSDPSPELRRVLRNTGTAQQQRFIIKDKNGVLITDAAGSPFDGGIPVTDYLGTFIFDRTEAHDTTKMSQAARLSGKLNSVAFAGCAAETLMLDVVGKEKFEGASHVWDFTYTMTYDKGGWQPNPVNAGLYQNTGTASVPIRNRILEADGSKTQEPQPLHSALSISPVPGAVIATNLRPGSCNFIDVDHYPTFDFAILGLNGL